MHVCHIITRFLRAGAEENIVITCNAQVLRGHRVTLIHGREHVPEMFATLDPRIERIQIPSMQREVNPYKDIAALVHCVQVLRAIRPDLVHTHTSKAGIIGRTAARFVRVKYIIHGVHILPFLNVPPVQRWIYVNLERLMGRFTDAFINVSQEMCDACLAVGVGDAERHHIALSGMDIGRFRSASRPADWATLVDPNLVAV